MGDTIEFELPDVGEGVAEGEVVAWHVDDGERVSEDQTVVEVETDKAVVDIPSPVDGTVRSRLAEEGEMVPVGDVLITFETDDGQDASGETGESPTATGDDTADATESSSSVGDQTGPADETPTDETAVTASSNGHVFARPSVRRLAREKGVDIAAAAENSAGQRITRRDVLSADDRANIGEGASSIPSATAGSSESDAGSGARPTADAASETTSAETGHSGTDAERSASSDGVATTTSANAADRDRTLAMPATRKRARELGVSLDEVPTEEMREGEAFVTPEALESFVAARERSDDGGRPVESASDRPERRVPYTGVRRTIGERMEKSMYTAPQVSHHEEVDASELVETRQRLKPEAEERDVNLTYLPFVMKACVAALKEHPVLNAELDEENGEIVEKHYYNFGVATDTDAGLMVPVIDNVDRKNVLEIATEMQDVVERARTRSIGREEMEGGTFTVTNIGGIGGKFGTPILNYPEVAILALGSLEEQPRVVDGEVVPRHVLPISLTSDHRVVDGGDAARFTNELKRYLENPSLLLLE